MKFSVSVHYLPNGILLKFDIWIHQMNAHVKLKFGHGSMIFENNKISVSVHYCPNGITHLTQIWHGYVKELRKLEFGHGSMVLIRIMPLLLWKKEIFSFCSLSPQQLYIFNSNLTYGYVIRINWPSSNLVMVWW
jgi:hypothetical protein